MRTITWAGHKFDLHACRAMHWRIGRAVIVADMHLGKAAAFRRNGIPVPEGGTRADLDRLTSLTNQAKARRLIILGDFLHARDGRSPEVMSLIETWRAAHSKIEMILVRGNHDHNAGDPPASWDIQCVDEPLFEGNLAFRHVPKLDDHETHQVAGHVHPCAMLHDVDGSCLRSPCFYFSDRVAILPAFGSFTGTHPIQPQARQVIEGKAQRVKRASIDRIFAIGPESVIEVRHARLARA